MLKELDNIGITSEHQISSQPNTTTLIPDAGTNFLQYHASALVTGLIATAALASPFGNPEAHSAPGIQQIMVDQTFGNTVTHAPNSPITAAATLGFNAGNVQILPITAPTGFYGIAVQNGKLVQPQQPVRPGHLGDYPVTPSTPPSAREVKRGVYRIAANDIRSGLVRLQINPRDYYYLVTTGANGVQIIELRKRK